jgi:hypothetical protein
MTMRHRGKYPVNSQSTNLPGIGDDTIELELTPEEWQHLSQAADAAAAQVIEPVRPAAVLEPDPIPAAPSSLQPLLTINPASRLHRWQVAPIAKMSGYIIAYAAFAWWSVSQLSGQPQPPATTAARPTAVVPRPALVASSTQPALKVINPFDATEVFEFPAGTSNAESHDKVAQILLQRARDRQSRWGRVKPAMSVRTASLYGSP